MLKWESIGSVHLDHLKLSRAKVPGGWLVMHITMQGIPTMCFYPDQDHEWDGNSLD